MNSDWLRIRKEMFSFKMELSYMGSNALFGFILIPKGFDVCRK